ncbi:MAG: hypothetical protein FWD31_05640, partial [Planctomycetaceae bacterium]|nr:hypothetical protein [Planctomycetaceae bacterium]
MKRIKILTTIVCVAVAAVMLWQVVPIAAQNPLSPFRASSGSGNPVSEQPAASFAASPNAMTPQPNSVSPETQKLLNPIAPMIDANTFFVGHIDLTRIDPETAAANLKMLAADILTKLRANQSLTESFGDALDDEGLVEALQMSMRGLDMGTMLVQSKLDELRSLGCNEIYLTANSKIMTVSAVQVVCLAPARNLAKLEQVLLLPEQVEFGWVFQHDGDKLIANLIAPFSTTSLDDANVGNRVAFQHRLIRPMLRPELAAGLERIKNAPVKLVFAPDGVIRGLSPMLPFMATSFHMMDNPTSMLFLLSGYGGMRPNLKFFDEGVRWMAVGLDPTRPVLAITVQSKSPEAAQEVHDMFISLKTMFSV